MTVASRGSTEAVGYCFPIIGLLVVAARLASRWRAKVKFGFDDWFCISAWIFVTGACTTLLVGLYHGAFFVAGSEDAEGLERQGHILAQVLASFVVLYTFANASVKFSILFYYRRIFSISRVFDICSWCLIAASAVWFVYGLLAWILYCGTYVRENFEGPFDNCPMWGVDVEQAVFVADSVIDFMILVVPIPMVLRLQLSVSKKILVLATFCVGGFAFVAGLNNTVVQLIYVVDPNNTGVEGASPDFAQGGDLILSVWPAIEIGVGLIACCLPSISMGFLRTISDMLVQGWRSISDSISRGSQTSGNASIANPGNPAGSSIHQAPTDGQSSNHDRISGSEIQLTHLPKSKVRAYSEALGTHPIQNPAGRYTVDLEGKQSVTESSDTAPIWPKEQEMA